MYIRTQRDLSVGVSETESRDFLSYGIVAIYSTCTVSFECDIDSKDMFVIRDNDGNILGKFMEV